MIGEVPYMALVRSQTEEAEKAERLGHWDDAAVKYMRGAQLLRKYAESLRSEAKKTALQQAEGWERRAESLRYNPPRPGSPSSASKFQEQQAQGGEENGLLALVEGMVVKGSRVQWDDIAGLEEVKREVKMAFALAYAQSPEGRGGLPVELPPWQRILLYGPGGTGKTMLAAAVSGQISGATFYNANWSNLASKWFGESERLVQLLYQVARKDPPAVIFLDEVDAVAASREASGESGAAKKVLSALLTAVDGVESKLEHPFVLTFAATNRPWALDQAFLSRFVKAIYVPLPDATGRCQILRLNLERKGFQTETSYDELTTITDGYSGRDLATLCQQVIVDMVYEQNPSILETVNRGIDALKDYIIKIRPVNRLDVERAMKKVRPAYKSEDVAVYEEWRQRMGY